MRVRLKGINRVKKRLANGSQVVYYYAWKGGPRLKGTPGSPEFIDSYNLALENRRVKPDGLLQSVLNKYLASPIFLGLADKTRRDYSRHIRAIEDDFGDFPIAALSDDQARGEFLEWRDKIGLKNPRQADYRFSVLARILSWAVDRGVARRTHARIRAVFITQNAWIASGQPKTKPLFTSELLSTFIWPSCWRFGPGSGKGIYSP